jgi:sortase A
MKTADRFERDPEFDEIVPEEEFDDVPALRPGQREAPREPVEEAPPVARSTALPLSGKIMLGVGVFIALFALFEFSVSGLIHARAQRDRLREFKDVVASGVGTLASWSPATGTPLGVLRIPAIGLQEVVSQGTTPDQLKGGPGHLRTSSLPGHVGNSVVEGRRTTYGDPFGSIDQLVQGNTIEVVTPQGPFTYLVVGKRVVLPGQPDVTGPSTDSRLTLVTSSPAVLARGRLAVIAKLQGAPLPALERTIAPLGSDESGLSGDLGAFGPIVVWLEFLALAIVLGVMLRRRRWNRRVAYLLGMPIFLALVLLVFENLDRLLPATL